MGTTVIIPAAGLASRLRPISNMTTKSMVPLNGKPTISYIINEIRDFATDIRIVYGKSDDIVDYCKNAYSDLPITYHKQNDPYGPLHAVYTALENSDAHSSNDLIIWLGDTIVLDYEHTPRTHSASVVYSEVEDWARWCMIGYNGEIIDKPVDKPDTNRALVGIYAFPTLSGAHYIIRDIINNQNRLIGNEWQISQLLNKYETVEQVETNEWYDCGDFPSLYESRSRLLNRLSRSDNKIHVNIDTSTISKSGERCKNEIAWYINVPSKIKPFLPTIYGHELTEYTMEYCGGNSLQESLVFENLKPETIHYIMNRVIDIYEKYFFEDVCNSYNLVKHSENMWLTKNRMRFNTYIDQYDFVKKEDVDFILEYIQSKEFAHFIHLMRHSNSIHGDLHLGNVLFDFNTGKVKFIDPRGEWDNEQGNHGDVEYDLAKLYQSCYGEYMWIVNGVPTDINARDELVAVLDERLKIYGTDRLRKLSLVMMASCLPFHNDDKIRQKRIWETSINKLKEILS